MSQSTWQLAGIPGCGPLAYQGVDFLDDLCEHPFFLAMGGVRPIQSPLDLLSLELTWKWKTPCLTRNMVFQVSGHFPRPSISRECSTVP